jgi:hypothetical protein
MQASFSQRSPGSQGMREQAGAGPMSSPAAPRSSMPPLFPLSPAAAELPPFELAPVPLVAPAELPGTLEPPLPKVGSTCKSFTPDKTWQAPVASTTSAAIRPVILTLAS